MRRGRERHRQPAGHEGADREHVARDERDVGLEAGGDARVAHDAGARMAQPTVSCASSGRRTVRRRARRCSGPTADHERLVEQLVAAQPRVLAPGRGRVLEEHGDVQAAVGHATRRAPRRCPRPPPRAGAPRSRSPPAPAWPARWGSRRRAARPGRRRARRAGRRPAPGARPRPPRDRARPSPPRSARDPRARGAAAAPRARARARPPAGTPPAGSATARARRRRTSRRARRRGR